ncbi:hypothetical protein DZC72_04710 [Maribacter algicola]|uniref:Uncharacterized protein n=1 Tax=Maribacter algicola TaxID=2498892 RepID=A0A426RLR1_9FLAO|nr:hypothetical protein [Maribacter algicola]RRQ49890.1 hypothetical protein DZC72_04710 [Maribacter algicola]
MTVTKKKSRPLIILLLVLVISPLTAQLRKIKDTAPLIVKRVVGMEDYSSTLDFNDNRKQLLMAGQNYQTNYGIYASIEIGESTLGQNYKTIKNIEFEIVNYKPTYFIGIDSVVVVADRNNSGATFKIYTRALSDKTNYILSENSLNNLHFEQGSYLHSERYLNPMFPIKDANGNIVYGKDGRIDCKPDNGKAFDFEFFYMDGRHVVRKEDYDKEQESELSATNEIAFSLPGRRCNTSFNKVVF